MDECSEGSQRFSFASFEVDAAAGELRRQGVRVKLQEQPFKILLLLLEHPGHVVTREQLQKRLWPADTFVDFEHGLNRAINRLREALRDDSEHPRFIETVPRRGYRFVGAVESALPSADARDLHPPVSRPSTDITAARRRRLHVVLACIAGVLVIALALPAVRGGLLSPRGGTDIRSLAVLPLQNLSADDPQGYFADGMTDELITEIGKISALRVVSRTSAMTFKHVNQPLRDIARQLGTDGIVEGTVLRAGGKVRITAQLIDAHNDTLMWSQNYDRDIGDVIAVQGEVARAIADRIRVRLSPRERTALSRPRAINPQAHEAYLEGRFFARKITEESLVKSVALSEQAASLDPSYAEAYSGLAQSYISLGIFGFRRPDTVYPAAKAAALKALALDDGQAEAHSALADIEKGYEWNWVAAEAEYKRALALNPSYTVAHMWYADYLIKMSRDQEAIAEAMRARELDPVAAGSYAVLGMIYYRARRYDDAIAACRKALEFDPAHHTALWFLALAHEQQGDLPTATSELETAVRLSDASVYRALLAHAYALGGRRAEAIRILTDLEERSKTRYVSPVDIAVIYTGLGDRDTAFTWLEKAFMERTMRIQELPDPLFDRLHDDPRFADLMRRIGLRR